MNNPKEFIECECGTHLLQVVSDIEETNPKLHSFYLAVYLYGYHTPLSWRYRWRYIWRLLRGKELYDDQITMTPEEAKKLSDFITRHLPTTP
jgi:hypothetical protein